MFLSLWIDLVQIRFDCSLCVLKSSLIWLRNWYYEDFENISCEINLDLSTRMFIFVNVNVLVLSISYYHTIEIHKYNCMYIYESAICLIIVIIVFPSAWLHLAIFEVRFRGAKVHWPTSISTTRCWEINICPKVITRPQAHCCWPRGNNKKKARAGFFRLRTLFFRRKMEMKNGVSSGQHDRMTGPQKINLRGQVLEKPPFGGNSAPGQLNCGLLTGKAKKEKVDYNFQRENSYTHTLEVILARKQNKNSPC